MIYVKSSANNAKVFKQINNTPKNFQRGARRAFYISGKELVNDVQTKMTKGPKSGRSYKVYRGIGGSRLKKPRLHIASSPSEYPAVISGKLRASVNFKVKGYTRLQFGAGNGSMVYPKVLEKRNKYLKRTIAGHRNSFKENLNREIGKSIGIWNQ